MAPPLEARSATIDDIRAMRAGGSRVSDIVRFLAELKLDKTEMSLHLNEAFLLEHGGPNLYFLPPGTCGGFDPQAIDDAFEVAVQEARSNWASAGPYPDLMRRRDRHVFRNMARQTGNIFIVRAANRLAGRYIGRSGFRPAPVGLTAVSRLTPPNEGLLAAEPADARSTGALQAQAPPLSNGQFTDAGLPAGFSIGSANEGYIIRDEAGNALHPCYLLHGVYDLETARNAWTAREGERLRAELNRRMGAELVVTGPYDIWAERLDLPKEDPRRAPRPPALCFLPDGNMSVCADADALEQFYRYYGVDWERLYPSGQEQPDEEMA